MYLSMFLYLSNIYKCHPRNPGHKFFSDVSYVAEEDFDNEEGRDEIWQASMSLMIAITMVTKGYPSGRRELRLSKQTKTNSCN